MRLINQATGDTIPPGAIVHVMSGPTLGQAWRYEKIRPHTDGGHRVHVTRSHPKLGRVHREFHAHMFGAEVKIEFTWQRKVINHARHAVSRVDEWLLAGLFAVIPLAFFEHYQMSSTIIEFATMGIMGGGSPAEGGH